MPRLPTCLCGTCQKCRRRACTQRLRARKKELRAPWAKSVRLFTLERLGYGQSALSEAARDAVRLLERSRRLRLQVFELMPVEGSSPS